MTVKLNKPAERLMVDRGCTSNVAFFENVFKKTENRDQKVNLVDDSTVKDNSKGILTVSWNGRDELDDVHVSETLVVPDLAMSLPSIPALVCKSIVATLLPGKTVLLELEDNFEFLGQSHQDKDGLSYIAADQTGLNAKKFKQENRVSAMVPIDRKEQGASTV